MYSFSKKYLAVLVLMVLCFNRIQAQNATSYYSQGVALYGQQKYDDAIDQFSKSINLNSVFANTYIYRGLCYYNKNRFQQAITDYSKAISLDPVNNLAYFDRGLAYYSIQSYDEAIADFTKLVNMNPSYNGVYNSRANAYYAKQQYQLAITDYTMAISQNPNQSNSYDYRGSSYYYLQKYDLAMQDYNKAISLNSADQYAYSGRGSVFFIRNQYDLAISDFTKSLQLNPNSSSTFVNRALVYDAIHENDQAIQDYSTAIQLNPAYTDAYNNRGLTYKNNGQYLLSVKDFEKVLSLDPGYTRAYINIVEPLARLNRFQDAAAYYASLRAKHLTSYVDDESWIFLKTYIEVITQDLISNNYQNAFKNISAAERLYSSKQDRKSDYQKSSFSSILSLKGYILEQLNRLDDAKQAYEQALLINVRQPEITAGLARIAKSQEILVKKDDSPPIITILEPEIKRSFTIEDDKPGSLQKIRGKAFDASGIRKLTINNETLKIEDGGYFETNVSVKEGVNVFTIVAMDNNANSTSANVVIEGSKETKKAAPPAPANSLDIPVMDNHSLYHAILIGETEYRDNGIKDLSGTVFDMRKIYNVLVNNYNFDPKHTDTLVNASKVTILESLIQKANAMSENDNLFIFYAGHGQLIKHEDNSEEGFLVPVDAEKNKTSSYISSDDLVRTIKYSKAKHILFVADACFAGSLFRDISADAPEPVAEAYKDKSRKLLASGNRQAVPDQSEFIEDFRLALQENRQKYITAEQLIDGFKNQYKATTHLQLQYYPIKNVDDLGGQFVFTRK